MNLQLEVNWCSYKAAKYAVLHWHYSGRMPKSKLNYFGVWEGIKYVGSIIFGVGATRRLLNPYGLKPEEGCELVRIALREHEYQVTEMVSKAISLLRGYNSGLRLIVSFADPMEGHHGGIYQAGNWIYTGTSQGCYFFKDKKGKVWHPRNVSEDLWRSGKVIKPSECEKVWKEGKHRYLYPLDKAMRRQVNKLAQSYPQAEQRSTVIA